MKLLLIGSITNSEAKYPDGIRKRFGGGIMYGGKAAAKLGIETTVITVGADDIEGGIEELRSLGLTVVRIPRPTSNNFSNDYTSAERKLYLRSFIKSPLEQKDISQGIPGFDSVILFPLFNEISPSLLKAFSNQTVMLDPQGFTRAIGEKTSGGLYPVLQSDWKNIGDFSGKVDVLKISNDDLSGIQFKGDIRTEEEKAQFLAEYGFTITILTRGQNSTILAQKNKPLTYVETYKLPRAKNPRCSASEYKAANSEVLSPAGAGEVFAVAFMHNYYETQNAVMAAKFGNACASLSVSGVKISAENAIKLIETSLR